MDSILAACRRKKQPATVPPSRAQRISGGASEPRPRPSTFDPCSRRPPSSSHKFRTKPNGQEGTSTKTSLKCVCPSRGNRLCLGAESDGDCPLTCELQSARRRELGACHSFSSCLLLALALFCEGAPKCQASGRGYFFLCHDCVKLSDRALHSRGKVVWYLTSASQSHCQREQSMRRTICNCTVGSRQSRQPACLRSAAQKKTHRALVLTTCAFATVPKRSPSAFWRGNCTDMWRAYRRPTASGSANHLKCFRKDSFELY